MRVALSCAIYASFIFPASAEDVVLTCRAVDTAGEPLEGVQVAVRTIPELDSRGNVTGQKEIVQKLAAPTDGIVTSPKLKSGRSYVLEFSKDGFVPQASRRSHPESSGIVKLPDVSLRRLRVVTGRVVDSNGRPLGGVVLSQSGDGPQRTKALSAEDGTFRLQGVPEGFALLFADCKGFWFGGFRAPTGDTAIEIVLTEQSKKNPDQCDLRKTPPQEDGDAVFSGFAIEPLVNDIRRLADEQAGNPVLMHWYRLERVDHARAMKLLNELPLPKVHRNVLVQQMIRKEMEQDFENGLAKLQQLESPDQRISTIIYDLLPDSNLSHDQKLLLTGIAVTDLHAVRNPLQRAAKSSQLLSPLKDIRAFDAIDQLVTDVVVTLDEAADAGAVKSRFGNLAERLAPIDADRALKLVARAPDMYRAWVAIGIADQRPKAAAKLMREYRFNGVGGSRLGRWYNLPRVCFRMASVDVDEALSLAELSEGIVDEPQRYAVYSCPGDDAASNQTASSRIPIALLLRARCHGLIVQAMAEKDPLRARQILESAIHDVTTVADGIRNKAVGFIYPPSVIMASLIPAAAKIDSGLAAETCWRMLATRFPDMGTDSLDASRLDIARLQYPLFLATMDADLARDLLRPVAARDANRSFGGRAFSWAVYSWRIVSAEQGREWLNTICNQGIGNGQSPQEQIRLLWMAQIHDNQKLNQLPILDQAEVWTNQLLWTHGITNSRY